jgi:hypothetical protein
LNDSEVNRRIAGRGAAAGLLAAGVILLSFTPADAQGLMRMPNFNVGSRTPNIIPRMNPEAAVPAAAAPDQPVTVAEPQALRVTRD